MTRSAYVHKLVRLHVVYTLQSIHIHYTAIEMWLKSSKDMIKEGEQINVEQT